MVWSYGAGFFLGGGAAAVARPHPAPRAPPIPALSKFSIKSTALFADPHAKALFRKHCVIFIFTEGETLKTIAVLLLSLVLVDAALASIIGQMKGIFVCDTRDTYNQAVDMIRQQNWNAVDGLVLSGRCTQISKGDVVVEHVTSLTGLVRVHPRGKTTSWWASAEEVHR